MAAAAMDLVMMAVAKRVVEHSGEMQARGERGREDERSVGGNGKGMGREGGGE